MKGFKKQSYFDQVNDVLKIIPILGVRPRTFTFLSL